MNIILDTSCVVKNVDNVGNLNSYILDPVGFIRSAVKGRQDAPRQGPETNRPCWGNRTNDFLEPRIATQRVPEQKQFASGDEDRHAHWGGVTCNSIFASWSGALPILRTKGSQRGSEWILSNRFSVAISASPPSW